MSTNQLPATTTQTGVGPPAIMEARSDIVYKPFGSDDSVKLSLAVIKNYVAVPHIDRQTQQPVLPDDRQCMKFMMLCRSRRLNPFEGDCFMIPFWDRKLNVAQWALVTGIEAFRKRSEMHPDYDGIASGVIVKNEGGEVIEREGDFLWPGDELLGGWARVEFKHRKIPTVRRLNLATYKKDFGQWLADPAGMIVTRAESHALRDSFPTLLGGMQLREEIIEVESEVVTARRPEFARGLPPVDVSAVAAQRGARRAITQPKPAAEAAPPQTTATEAKPEPTQPAPEPAPPAAEQEAVPAPAEAPAAPDAAPEPTSNETPIPAETAPAAPAEAPAPAQNGATAPEIEEKLRPTKYDTDLTKQVKTLCLEHGVTFDQMWTWLRKNQVCKPEQKALTELSERSLTALANPRAWAGWKPQMLDPKFKGGR